MKKIITLLLFSLVLPIAAFSQNDKKPENRPQAYQIRGGERKVEPSRPQAYVVREISDTVPRAYQVGSSRGGSSSNFTRPRVYSAGQSKTVSTSNAKTAFDLERRAFDLINEQRKNSGLPPLKWSDDVARIARLHSENMANYNFFSHQGIDGLMVNDRADVLGISRWKAIGENIAFNQGFDNPVEFAVERWMQSPKHRDNLLSSRWKESGIGIAVTANGTYYFTEVFLLK